jgi:hypothetical protein
MPKSVSIGNAHPIDTAYAFVCNICIRLVWFDGFWWEWQRLPPPTSCPSEVGCKDFPLLGVMPFTPIFTPKAKLLEN